MGSTASSCPPEPREGHEDLDDDHCRAVAVDHVSYLDELRDLALRRDPTAAGFSEIPSFLPHRA